MNGLGTIRYLNYQRAEVMRWQRKKEREWDPYGGADDRRIMLNAEMMLLDIARELYKITRANADTYRTARNMLDRINATLENVQNWKDRNK